MTPKEIKQLVADAYDTTPEALNSKYKTDKLVEPRSIAMWLMRKDGYTLEVSGWSLAGATRQFMPPKKGSIGILGWPTMRRRCWLKWGWAMNEIWFALFILFVSPDGELKYHIARPQVQMTELVCEATLRNITTRKTWIDENGVKLTATVTCLPFKLAKPKSKR